MRRGGLLLLFVLAVWRVGAYVSWDLHVFAREFSPDLESKSPSAADCSSINGSYCKFKAWAQQFKANAASRIQAALPSPHSELVMGMVLGEDQFKLIPRYNDILKKVGLVHVVVVSGYNISLVFTLLMRILGSQYKVKNLILGLVITLVYAGISGFGVPAVRAWIMGSIAVIFKFYGRPAEGLKVLIFSAIVILCLAPDQLFSVSFILSFLATLGVMVVPEALDGLFRKFGVDQVPVYLADFATSLSAQLMVNPVLSYYFGTISLVSLVANPLVLWVVPICTTVGGLMVMVAFVSPLLTRVLAFVLFPFLDLFVSFSEFFAHFMTASVDLRFNIYGVGIYYMMLFFGLKLCRGGRSK
ncbi:ComEC/Rec2 family competence protein [Patescibacteria group bacterium]|nr:ComEC/Rec2 family competence protein [Patescibacteria group bacterium]